LARSTAGTVRLEWVMLYGMLCEHGPWSRAATLCNHRWHNPQLLANTALGRVASVTGTPSHHFHAREQVPALPAPASPSPAKLPKID